MAALYLNNNNNVIRENQTVSLCYLLKTTRVKYKFNIHMQYTVIL